MKDKLKALWTKIVSFGQSCLAELKNVIEGGLSAFWNSNKALIAIAVPILVIIKFRSAIIDFFLYLSKIELSSAEKENSKLYSQEVSEDVAANEYIDHATKAPSKEKPVNVDWYKDK